MRLAMGLFAVLATGIASIVAFASLPLTYEGLGATQHAPVIVLAVNYHVVGFCVLALIFSALLMVSDDWISVVGFVASASLAALLSTPVIASSLVLALASIGWLVFRPAQAPEPPAERPPARPNRLRPSAMSAVPRTAPREADDGSLPPSDRAAASASTGATRVRRQPARLYRGGDEAATDPSP